jgi:hypothetical protein
VLGGECDGARDEVAVLAESDLDGPVGPVQVGEFTGTVRWINDPDPIPGQPVEIVDVLLGEDGVAGHLGSETVEEGTMGSSIPGGLTVGAVGELLGANP